MGLLVDGVWQDDGTTRRDQGGRFVRPADAHSATG